MSYEFPGIAWLGEEWVGEGVDRVGWMGPTTVSYVAGYKLSLRVIKRTCGL